MFTSNLSDAIISNHKNMWPTLEDDKSEDAQTQQLNFLSSEYANSLLKGYSVESSSPIQ